MPAGADQNIAALDVAVDDAQLMRLLQPAGDLDPDADRVLDLQPSARDLPRRQRFRLRGTPWR